MPRSAGAGSPLLFATLSSLANRLESNIYIELHVLQYHPMHKLVSALNQKCICVEECLKSTLNDQRGINAKKIHLNVFTTDAAIFVFSRHPLNPCAVFQSWTY